MNQAKGYPREVKCPTCGETFTKRSANYAYCRLCHNRYHAARNAEMRKARDFVRQLNAFMAEAEAEVKAKAVEVGQ